MFCLERERERKGRRDERENGKENEKEMSIIVAGGYNFDPLAVVEILDAGT